MIGWLLMAVVPVWIDTDPSISRGRNEVDDGYALIQAFRSPELRIAGVSTVFGNAPLAEADPIGRRRVKEFGPRGLRVYRGAAGPPDLGRETPATRALAAALRRERLTILLLGPATNVASLLRLHPELSGRIERIIAVAGRRPGQRFEPVAGSRQAFADFNFESDAESFQVLLDAKVPLVLAPWELSSKVWLGEAELGRLASSGKAGRYLAAASRDWLAMWKAEFGAPGFNPFDSLAVAWVTHRSLLKCASGKAMIELGPDDTGRVAGKKPYLLYRETSEFGGPVEYCHDVQPSFTAALMDKLTR
jgi:pyrimidine-specific ribonucleoside hydrolase